MHYFSTMDEQKKINLQQHVSPKASRTYVVKILIYVGLLGGLIALIYFLQDGPVVDQHKQTKAPTDLDSVEVRGVTVAE